MNEIAIPRPNDLDAFWMPFSDNKYFKGTPRLLARAEGMHYYTPEGRKVLDGTSGLWCVNAGHCRKPIVEAVQKQVAKLEFRMVAPNQGGELTEQRPVVTTQRITD